jgi:histone H3/H4
MASQSQDDDFAAPAKGPQNTMRREFAAAVAAVVDSEGRSPPASSVFVQQLTEVAWAWTTTALAPDLESFARHSKRANVGVEDVLLAARKNDVTHSLIEREMSKVRPVKQRRTGGAAGAAGGGGVHGETSGTGAGGPAGAGARPR